EPGMSNFTQHLKYSILRRRPLDVTVRIAQMNGPELYTGNGQSFLPADAEDLFHKTMKLVNPGDVNETLNAAAHPVTDVTNALPEPEVLTHTFNSGAEITFHGIGAPPKGEN